VRWTLSTLKSRRRGFLAEGKKAVLIHSLSHVCVMYVCESVCACVCSEENTPLDLDDHGGRTFLRVLLHLTMHDYPPLVSRALHLLFRHFSQRQEVLQAFKQVFIHSFIHSFIYPYRNVYLCIFNSAFKLINHI